MLSGVCWLMLAVGLPVNAERVEPPSAVRVGHPDSVAAWCRGQALLWAVRAGATPALVELTFGAPASTGRFRDGPVEWWYTDLGVAVFFSPHALRPVGPPVRVFGVVQ